MELWDDISKKISEAADYTVKETEKLTLIAKLKYKLSSVKNKKDLLYQSVGKLKYEEIVLGKETSEELYDGFFSQITEASDEIAELENTIARLSNRKICEACGYKLTKEMAFCPKCGAKRPDEQPPKTGETQTEDADENDTNGQ
ncbi:MAG: hypothetical protein PUE85_04795 [Firmicutes bacterium]|nr:hypothetical protein [Bacillota bacterium]